MKVSKLIVALISIGVIAGAAQAQELTGTLKKIKDTGTITLGVRDSSIPFSYLDDKQSYQGYSIDLCMKAATAIQKQLGMTALNVKMVPVTSATRIPLISNGAIDLSCDSATNNLERQKVVSFAPTMFVTANRLLAKKTSNITKLDDLKGKTIVSTSGTSNLKQITELNGERKLGMNILAAKDHAEAFLMVETGRAVAFAMDDILLSSLAASSKAPKDYSITTEALSVEPYGIIERSGDLPFKKAVDTALTNVYKSGEINKIYAKWFLAAIPPKGITLNIPMSPELKAAFAKPTDSGDPATYAAVPEAQKESSKKK
ncbi:amino acid ABC transporter substrate-binding protein [Glaciimonas sp. CA11.2]|uniref:amino acid ABC transporter substrate-binding protein n=1 Tax=unclassified Glaciimonas TaxID=2644401 RepID=UPI002AB3F2E2|nr:MULTISPECIES: amino acid ABC transporter substrate-binding protein [unclassified Glaciimonas]MDY7546457.1 amino acid ABC transporter substrate-binding protein [Glaciimonas sp. CA11.2]MEB0012848.1 amino acid ABC transporter substrate-binding protein [Glaciimonas sp. Cout2]MEB0080861.1 amino acid ABC transporter substrate-binding protein [Glaciimonas sp. Gout2]MEB0163903.1 amino acid ABC transporter substrate-binding protein [Glaciimonas sp. CA11.2]